jgi:hypothetical protein
LHAKEEEGHPLANSDNHRHELLEMVPSSAKPTDLRSINDLLNSLVLPKEWRAVLSANASKADVNARNEESTSLLPGSLKSLSSLKNNKNHLFDNISHSFTGSKILSLQALSDLDSQKRFQLSSWGLPPPILQVVSPLKLNLSLILPASYSTL